MFNTLASIFALTILICGVIAIYKYSTINKVFHPFIWCVWVACVNEILGAIFSTYGIHTLAINNIYVLIEAMLLTMFFYRLGDLNKSKKVYLILLLTYVMIWTGNCFIFGSITTTAVYFRVFYSFVIILLSVNYMNKLVFRHNQKLFKNAGFLLCLSFIFFFTYKILIFSFVIFGSHASRSFLMGILKVMIYINLITNLIYSYAVLWMPRKVAFTSQY